MKEIMISMCDRNQLKKEIKKLLAKEDSILITVNLLSADKEDDNNERKHY